MEWRRLILERIRRSADLREFLRLMALALPVMGAYLLQMSLGVVNILFVGHLGQLELAAAALGNMYLNVTGYSVVVGLLSAMDTLCSQFFGRAHDSSLTAAQQQEARYAVGYVLQRSMCVVTLLCVPVLLLWIFCEQLLLVCGQDPAVADAAALFVWYQLPAFWFYGQYETLKRYLQAQSILAPCVIVNCIGLLCNILLNFLLVYVFELGLRGSSISMSISLFTMWLSLAALIRYRGYHRATWEHWSWREAFGSWLLYFKLALPGVFMLCAEWWAYEVYSLLAGLLGTLELATEALLLNTLGLLFQCPLGLSIAASVRVGNQLGAGKPVGALRSARVTTYATLGIMCSLGALLMACRSVWPYVFSSDPEVIQLSERVLPMLAGLTILDGLQGSLSGVLRGCGKQVVGAVVNLTCYYLIGLPISALLSFHFSLGLYGLWFGQSIAAFLCSVCFVLFVFLYRWYVVALVHEETLCDDELPERNDCEEVQEPLDGAFEVELQEL